MRPHRVVTAAAVALLVGCSKAPAPPTVRQSSAVGVRAEPPAADDSAATLAWFERQAVAIDADSLRFTRRELPLRLGAGAAGSLTAWRDGMIWTHLHVETRGAGFQASDNYWLRNGVLLGARLTVLRPGRRPAIDRIWFRDRALYRWTNASGEHLNPKARSTQYELRMMRTGYDSLLHLLAADDLTR